MKRNKPMPPRSKPMKRSGFRPKPSTEKLPPAERPELASYEPLKRGLWRRRNRVVAAELPKARKVRRYTGPDDATRTAMYERDGWRCVRCGSAGGFANPLDPQHRKPRGMGGTKDPRANGLANLVSLCRRCHEHVEYYREEGFDNGWLVRQHAEPSEVPVLTKRYGRVLLDNDGGWHPVPYDLGGAA